MQDLTTRLARLTRPRILTRAAQVGADSYDRRRDLIRLIGHLPRSGPAMIQLFELEDMLNAARTDGTGTYRPRDHLSVLIALIAEARLLGEQTG